MDINFGTIDYIVEEEIEEEKDDKQTNSVIDNIVKTIKQMTIGKFTSGSGKERMTREGVGFSMFKYLPITGLGFGSFRTFTLGTNILINTGIAGLISFIYILYVPISELIKYRKKEETASIIFLIAIIGTTAAFCVGVPDLTFLYYWMIIVFGYKYATLEK